MEIQSNGAPADGNTTSKEELGLSIKMEDDLGDSDLGQGPAQSGSTVSTAPEGDAAYQDSDIIDLMSTCLLMMSTSRRTQMAQMTLLTMDSTMRVSDQMAMTTTAIHS